MKETTPVYAFFLRYNDSVTKEGPAFGGHAGASFCREYCDYWRMAPYKEYFAMRNLFKSGKLKI
ncbi:MAG: hypothetical protein MZV63_56430 [Marinilabiliales bacterium]|nr:hypothetical protein [Marinilabiliales bacterium]